MELESKKSKCCSCIILSEECSNCGRGKEEVEYDRMHPPTCTMRVGKREH